MPLKRRKRKVRLTKKRVLARRQDLSSTIPILSAFIKRLLIEPKDNPHYYRMSSQAPPFVILYKEITKLARKMLNMRCCESLEECVVHFYSTCFTLILKEIIRRDDISGENVQHMSKRLFQLIPTMLHQWKRQLPVECLSDLLSNPYNSDPILEVFRVNDC
jgi:hypothetical protein